MEKNKKLWFGNKTYGWGWVPTSWQGWASIGIYGLVVAGATNWLAHQNDAPQMTSNLLYTLMMFISTSVLVLISRLKGTKPSWNWGNKNDTKGS